VSTLDNITRCPRCQTAFRVTNTQLSAAGGAVRCGSCLEVFHASAYLSDAAGDAELADAVAGIALSDAVLGQNERAGMPADAVLETADREGTRVGSVIDLQDDDENPVESSAVVEAADIVTGVKVEEAPDDESLDDESLDRDEGWSGDGSMQVGLEVPDDGGVTGFAVGADQSVLEVMTEAESEAPDYTAVQRLSFEEQDPAEIFGAPEALSVSRQWPWVIGALLLLLVLGAQYTWYTKDRLAQNVITRPYYQQFCRYVGCQLQTYQNSAALTASELIVRSHPTIPNALKVDAIIKNSGAFGQVFPNLRLSFVDVNGAHVAQRTFTPGDYLAGELVGLRYFPAQTEVRLSLSIVDPGKAALGYDLMVEPAS
jgi:predicted Zn finger-like uncharacterized protein